MAGQGPSHVTQGGTSGCWVGGGSELALALRRRRLAAASPPGETVELMADGQKSPPCSPTGITRRPRELARCGCPVIRLMMGGRAPIREHPSWSCERTPRHHPTREPCLPGMRGHLRRSGRPAGRPAGRAAAPPLPSLRFSSLRNLAEPGLVLEPALGRGHGRSRGGARPAGGVRGI